MLTKVKPIANHIDLSLELPFIENTGEIFIINLPTVFIDRIYIIDISKVYKRGRLKHRPRLVLVNWDIIWI